MASTKTVRTCSKGHQYHKSSDCPTCPDCEKINTSKDGFLASLSAPARRALQTAGITTAQHLAKYTQKEILKLHGMGPASIPALKTALKKHGLEFETH